MRIFFILKTHNINIKRKEGALLCQKKITIKIIITTRITITTIITAKEIIIIITANNFMIRLLKINLFSNLVFT